LLKQVFFDSSPSLPTPFFKTLFEADTIMGKITDKQSFKKNLLCLLVINVVGIITYYNSFYASFVFDDIYSILNNEYIKDISNFYPWNIHDLPSHISRRFISYLTLAVNYQFGEYNVFGYHVFNLTIHLVNAVLVYFLVISLYHTPRLKNIYHSDDQRRFAALFAALLFVCHPLQTQAVTYIVQRMTSLAALFCLLAMVIYLRGRLILVSSDIAPDENGHSNKVGRISIPHVKALTLIVTASLMCGMAMKTKEYSFLLPFMIVLVEIAFFTGSLKRKFLCLLPIVLTLHIIPMSILNARGPLGMALSDLSAQSRETLDISRLDYLYTQFRVIVTYLRLWLFPANQNLDYDYPIYSIFLNPHVISSFLFLAALFLLGIILLFWRVSLKNIRNNDAYNSINQEYRLIGFGILWFFVALSLESSVFPISDVIFEHRMYFPSVGLCIVSSTAIFFLFDKLKFHNNNKVLFLVAAAIISVLSMTTFQRNKVWETPVSLWRDTLLKSPGKTRPAINLGAAYGQAGQMDLAIGVLTEATRNNPDNSETYINLGAAFASVGRLRESIRVLDQAVKIDPTNPHAYNNLGIVLKDVGDYQKSVNAFYNAIKYYPDYARAYYNLGQTFQISGSSSGAVEAYTKAIKLDPGYSNAYLGLANLLKQEKQYQGTAALLIENMNRLKDRPEAHYLLGMATHCLDDRVTASQELSILQGLDTALAQRLSIQMQKPCDRLDSKGGG